MNTVNIVFNGKIDGIVYYIKDDKLYLHLTEKYAQELSDQILSELTKVKEEVTLDIQDIHSGSV